MQRTPLHQFHVKHGARMVDFAGWEMPIMYRGVHAEHHQVRRSAGVFDVSHMGRVGVKGHDATRFLERLCTRRISDMKTGQCRYSLICNERGGVRDDILVYRVDEDDYLLVVNASNRLKLLPHFEQVRGDLDANIEDRTIKTAMAALQGPRVMDLISPFSEEIPALKRYHFTVKNLMIVKVIVSRTGYTGEDGVEIILPANMAATALNLLLKEFDMNGDDAPILPAGLAARDTLRMEAGMPLYGHELNEDRCALSCGVNFAINLDKESDGGEPFVGHAALAKIKEQGVEERIVGLLLEGKRTARQGMPVLSGDEEVGAITSACLSPTLERPIAIACVKAKYAQPDTALHVDTGKSRLEAQVTKLPFYKAPRK